MYNTAPTFLSASGLAHTSTTPSYLRLPGSWSWYAPRRNHTPLSITMPALAGVHHLGKRLCLAWLSLKIRQPPRRYMTCYDKWFARRWVNLKGPGCATYSGIDTTYIHDMKRPSMPKVAGLHRTSLPVFSPLGILVE